MTQREEFLSIFRQHVARPGADRLLDWLDQAACAAEENMIA